MDWLFERMIELAAWAAFILGIVFLCDSLWMLFFWMQDINADGSSAYLAQSCPAAIKFIGAALALGTLAVIDRYVFDLDDKEISLVPGRLLLRTLCNFLNALQHRVSTTRGLCNITVRPVRGSCKLKCS